MPCDAPEYESRSCETPPNLVNAGVIMKWGHGRTRSAIWSKLRGKFTIERSIGKLWHMRILARVGSEGSIMLRILGYNLRYQLLLLTTICVESCVVYM